MKLVLDVSVALSWCFGDEADPYGEAVLHVLEDHEALVPALWCQEMSNVLLSAKRRKRLDSKQLERALRLLGELPIEVVPLPRNVVFERVLPLADRTGLTVYDATYLDVCLQKGLRLATMDEELREAGKRADALFEPLGA